MIKILGDISGILCTVILFFNFLDYFLKILYLKTDNITLKKTINLFLPIISKYNTPSIFVCFILFLIHAACFFINVNYPYVDIICLSILIIVLTFNFKTTPKYLCSDLRKIASYTILFFIIFHIFNYI